MPNRVLKESINESRGLTSCTFFAQDLYKRLITYADDYGRFNADPQIMLARLYPRELDVVLIDDIMDGIIELVGVGKIAFYTAKPRGEVYGAFPNWKEHQRIRDSKKKAPDPSDTGINDWYLKRFIPMDMKIAVIQRDGFKCKICGKHLWSDDNAKKFAKNGSGLFHIDHEVPVFQGGRATMENLRLTCPKCNQSRKKSFTFDEILELANTRGDSPQSAAELRFNPIQSNPESESESESEIKARDRAECDRFADFWSVYPNKVKKSAANAAWKSGKCEKIADTIIADVKRRNDTEWKGQDMHYIPHPTTYLHQRRWEDETAPTERKDGTGREQPRSNAALDYEQREYKTEDFGDDFFIDLDKYGEG